MLSDDFANTDLNLALSTAIYHQTPTVLHARNESCVSNVRFTGGRFIRHSFGRLTSPAAVVQHGNLQQMF